MASLPPGPAWDSGGLWWRTTCGACEAQVVIVPPEAADSGEPLAVIPRCPWCEGDLEDGMEHCTPEDLLRRDNAPGGA